MSKRDQFRAMDGNMAESIGAGRQPDFPDGMHPAEGRGNPERLVGVSRSRDFVEIDVTRIVFDPAQPRTIFDQDALDRLGESIRARGQLQPIRVRWDAETSRYVVLTGERRVRAIRAAGIRTVKCVVQDQPLSRAEILLEQLAENLLRDDLKPIEQARAYRSLMEETGWSGRQLAAELHISDGTIVRALALLDLPPEIQEQVGRGELTPAAAYEVSKLDQVAAQQEVARKAAEDRLTRDEVAEIVRARRGHRTVRAPSLTIPVEKRKRVVVHGTDDPKEAAALLRAALRRLTETEKGKEAA